MTSLQDLKWIVGSWWKADADSSGQSQRHLDTIAKRLCLNCRQLPIAVLWPVCRLRVKRPWFSVLIIHCATCYCANWLIFFVYLSCLDPWDPRYESWYQKTRFARLLDGENLMILWSLVLTHHRRVPDKRTDGQTDTPPIAELDN